MATTTTTTILLLTTLLFTTIPPTQPLPFSDLRTLISLSHSLTTRVATLRTARGDHAAAARATHLAKNIENFLGFNFYKSFFSLGYDFLKNYAFTRTTFTTPSGLASSFAELSELVSSLTELTRINSVEQRAVWVSKNYGKVVRVSRGLFDRLVSMFSREGPLKEAVEALRMEVVEGELLKDCLELGSNDLVGVVQILKDIASQYYDPSSKKTEL